jgi:hypothetical protein
LSACEEALGIQRLMIRQSNWWANRWRWAVPR